MSKAISLKIEDQIFHKTEELISELKISRNKYINDALENYNRMKEKEKINALLVKASILVRDNNIEVMQDFEGSSLDME
jgi:metal-responsive CopG/Arc/MetJ family transcriptional regulator